MRTPGRTGGQHAAPGPPGRPARAQRYARPARRRDCGRGRCPLRGWRTASAHPLGKAAPGSGDGRSRQPGQRHRERAA
ncbi:hypothetical protein G6F24_018794 [Rhizopus arrhizus]|nr:hypothetical protein G6F24_018794 [Rhizopus arrhizus]